MIRKCRSLIVAFNVVNLIQNDHRAEEVSAYIDSYQNCREQGFQVVCGRTAFFIAEHRNSDSIVVYEGEPSNQSLSDHAYRNPHFFDCGKYEDAADYILKRCQELKKLEKGEKN